jgi:hypothetical protein
VRLIHARFLCLPQYVAMSPTPLPRNAGGKLLKRQFGTACGGITSSSVDGPTPGGRAYAGRGRRDMRGRANVAFSAGLLLGGALVASLSWRSIFFLDALIDSPYRLGLSSLVDHARSVTSACCCAWSTDGSWGEMGDVKVSTVGERVGPATGDLVALSVRRCSDCDSVSGSRRVLATAVSAARWVACG